jgi:hypothetical protein
MSHLSADRLAALSDDTPSPIEAQHITTCTECTAELVAQRRLARMAAAASSSYGPPSSNFERLVPRLQAEGIMAAPDRKAMVRRWTLRAAAAVGFVAVGVAAGRMSVQRAAGGMDNVASGGAIGAQGVAQRTESFKSQDDAVRALMASQEAYQNAAAFLAAQDTSQRFISLNSDSYRTRLAAIDEMTAASRAGLYRAPQDPLLNQYYLTLQTAREQTLRALAVSLPSNQQMRKY